MLPSFIAAARTLLTSSIAKAATSVGFLVGSRAAIVIRSTIATLLTTNPGTEMPLLSALMEVTAVLMAVMPASKISPFCGFGHLLAIGAAMVLTSGNPYVDTIPRIFLTSPSESSLISALATSSVMSIAVFTYLARFAPASPLTIALTRSMPSCTCRFRTAKALRTMAGAVVPLVTL